MKKGEVARLCALPPAPVLVLVSASAADKRGFIRGIAWDAEQAGAPLVETLKSVHRALLKGSMSGKVLVGTASGGTSVQYSVPTANQSVTADDWQRIAEEVLTLAETKQAETEGITDEALLVDLLKFYAEPPQRPVRMVRQDFANGLRR